MTTQIDTATREIVLVEDAHIRPMMGIDVLESLPSAQIPYELVDPFILVHEGVVPITPEMASLDTRHPPCSWPESRTARSPSTTGPYVD